MGRSPPVSPSCLQNEYSACLIVQNDWCEHLLASTPSTWPHFLPTSPHGVNLPFALLDLIPIEFCSPCATSHLLSHTAVICELSRNIYQLLGSFQDRGWSFSTLYSQHPESSPPWPLKAELQCSGRNTAQGPTHLGPNPSSVSAQL